MLTARMAVEDRVAALDIGADDYLVKPFDLRELQARVRALGRRSGPDRGGMIEFGRLALDPAGRVASCDGAPLSLTRREFSLLEALMANRARVMPKERLFDRMFSMDEEEIGLNAIETYVARLRRKLEGSGRGDPHAARARLPAGADGLSDGPRCGAPAAATTLSHVSAMTG